MKRPHHGLKLSKSSCSIKEAAEQGIASTLSKRIALSDFKLVSVLGEGAYGQVYQAYNLTPLPTIGVPETGHPFAIKVIDKRIVTRDEKIHEVHTEKAVLQFL